MTAPEAYIQATGVHYDKTAGTYSSFVYETRNWHDRAYFIPISYAETQKNTALIQNPRY
jgi:hypothetical protein